MTAADEACTSFPQNDSGQLLRLLASLVVVKENAAAATPGPPLQGMDDGYTRALLM
jgi:hypothetical protein